MFVSKTGVYNKLTFLGVYVFIHILYTDTNSYNWREKWSVVILELLRKQQC